MTEIKKTKSKVGKEGNVWVYITLMAFPVAQFVLFYLIVCLNSFKMAFQELDPTTYEVIGVTMSNFASQIKMLFSYDTLLMVKISLYGYLTHLIVGVPLGILFAYYIFIKRRGAGLFRVLLFLPSIIPAIALVTIFRYSADNALPSVFQKLFSLEKTPVGYVSDKATQLVMILFYNVFIGFGASVLMYANRMSGIEPSLFEAARLDGANQAQEFLHVALPQTYSTLSVFLTTSVASIFTNQMNLFSFFGWNPPAGMQSFGYYFFYNSSRATTYNDMILFSQLSALGLIMSCIAIPLTFIVRWLLQKFGPKEE